MSAIFKTDSGIFNSLEANEVSITGQITISGNSVATENYVVNVVQGGVDYTSEINHLSGNLDTATSDINYLSGNLDTATSDISYLSGNLDTVTGDINEISGVVQNLSASSTTYGDSNVATYLNGNLDSHIIPDTNSTYDIGSAEYKIRHLYLSDNSLYIGETSVSATEQGEIVFPSGINTSGINIYGSIGGVNPSQENSSIEWDDSEKRWKAGDKTTNLQNNLTTTSGHLYSFYKPDNNIISNVSGNFIKLNFQNYDAPLSSASIGVKGEITYDNDYMYICVDTNLWKRIALSDF